MKPCYPSSYDAVIIGAALAGLTAAITLADKGLKVLVLEQHNLPGGVATSFVRGGAEIEASLHEMCCIGSKEHPLHVRQYFEQIGVPIDWTRVDNCFRYVSPDMDIVLPAGKDGDFSLPAKTIADAVGDPDGNLYQSLMSFFDLCHELYRSMNILSKKKMGKIRMFLQHRPFVLTAGYTCKEIFDHYHFPTKVRQILSAYWVYLGSPIEDLPFSIYAYILADYIGYGPYLPPHTSYELSAKLEKAAKSRGVTIAYESPVSKILVEKGKVRGVRLFSGEEILCPCVISGAYPNTVYSSLIEPKTEIPSKAKKWVNSSELGVSVFSVVLLLDQEAKDLGIKDYATFVDLKGEDSSYYFDQTRENGDWDYLTVVCPNVLHEDVSPKGTCLYSVTALPLGSSIVGLSPEQYEKYKARHVEAFLKEESARLGFDLREHILEIVVETPLTIAHYTSAYHGTIYGYRHTMHTHVAARTLQQGDDKFIDGLYFAGAHQLSGDGMAPQISHGISAGNALYADWRKHHG